MRISGHKTRSVFERYNLVSERNLHGAARKLGTYVAERAETDQLGTPQGGSGKSGGGIRANLLN